MCIYSSVKKHVCQFKEDGHTDRYTQQVPPSIIYTIKNHCHRFPLPSKQFR